MTGLGRKDRVRRALRREPVDRLPTQTNYTPAMGRLLARHFGIDLAELPDRLADRLADLGEFFGTEDEQGDGQDEDELRHSDISEHLATFPTIPPNLLLVKKPGNDQNRR